MTDPARLSTTAADTAAQLETHGKRARCHGSHYRAQCPVCNGRDLSVWLKDGDYGPVRVQCHRCDAAAGSDESFCGDFAAAIGLPRDTFLPPKVNRLPSFPRRSPPCPPRPPQYLCNTDRVRAALPKGAGAVVRLVADDLAGLIAERRAAGDYRSQPYAASYGAARLGRQRQSVQRALKWLVDRDVLVVRPLWKRADDHRSATLAYRFSDPSVLRGEAGGPAVAGPVEAPAGASAIGGLEPIPERHHVDDVTAAELPGPLVGIEVGERGLGAVRDRAVRPVVVHETKYPAASGGQKEAA